MEKSVLGQDSFSFLQEQYDKALQTNENSSQVWEAYKENLEEVKQNLVQYSKQLKVPVMVPIGKKAFMKGNLVHTNECLVNLGDGWFVKQSAAQTEEFCKRRLAYCDEKLNSLKKELNFLETHQKFPIKSDAFPEANAQEIIEPYNEEVEAEWRIKHREREREYRKKLAEQRKREHSKKDEDVWEKLNRLELEEKSVGEENIDEAENPSEEDEYLDEEDCSTDTLSDEYDKEEDAEEEKVEEKSKSAHPETERKRSITFNLEEPNDDDIIVIKFRHSKTPDNPYPNPKSDSENSEKKPLEKPSDIYQRFSYLFKPKSILKKSASLDHEFNSRLSSRPVISCSASEGRMPFQNTREIAPAPVEAEPLPQVFGDIIERKADDILKPPEPSEPSETTSKPKISKFKAARKSTS